MHAVIKTGGRQIKVAVGDTFKIHKMPVDTGNEVAFDEVLLLTDGAGNVTIGQPLVKGAKVLAKVLSHGRGVRSLSKNSDVVNITIKSKVIVKISLKLKSSASTFKE